MKNILMPLKILRKILDVYWDTRSSNAIFEARQNISKSFQQLDLALEEWEKYQEKSRNLMEHHNKRTSNLNTF
jgi:hypothetical protein